MQSNPNKKKNIFNEFYVDGGLPANSHVLIHLTEPVSAVEKLKGYFFALIETKNFSSKEIAKLEKIIQDGEQYFYEDKSPLHSQSFTATMQHIKTLTESVGFEGQMNAVVGVIFGTNILLSTAGNPVLWSIFIHKGKNHVYDLTPTGLDVVDNFSNIIEGEIKLSQKFFLSTPTILNFIDKDRFLKISRDKSTQDTCRSIAKILLSIGGEVSYGGILIDGVDLKPISKTEAYAHVGGNNGSVQEFIAQQDKTADVLSPKFKFSIEPVVQIIKSLFGAHKKDEVRREQIKKMQEIASKWTPYAKKIIPKFKSWIETLSPITKFMFFGAIVAVVLFFISLSYLSLSQSSREQQTTFDSMMNQISEKRNQIESSLIYKDEKNARKYLNEALSILNSVQTNSNSQEKNVAAARTDLKTVSAKLQKFVNIAATKLFDFKEAKFNANSIIVNGNKIIAGGSGKELLVYDIASGKYDKITPEGSDGGFAFVESDEDGLNYAIDFNGNAYEFKDASDIKKTNLIISRTELNATPSVAFYASRIYTLDKSKQQIHIRRKTEDSFGSEELWNRETLDITEVRDIVIDGNMFMLFKNKVEKLRLGKLQPFTTQTIEPQLDNPIKLAQTGGSLYILDTGAEKRIIHISKEGALIEQLTNTEFKNPTDLAVTPDEKNIYVLDDNTLILLKK